MAPCDRILSRVSRLLVLVGVTAGACAFAAASELPGAKSEQPRPVSANPPSASDPRTAALEFSNGCVPGWIPTFGDVAGFLGTAVGYGGPDVRAFALFDDGSGGGPALYAGGSFARAGSTTMWNVSKWDGSRWVRVGTSHWGTNAPVHALHAFDDGTGAALYVGGEFTLAGALPASRVARWDGTQWSGLGPGLNGSVWALGSFDDGGGPALYAGGTFTASFGTTMKHVARWDGTQWSALGDGLSARANALKAFDDGNGPALYVGGEFTSASGVPTGRIARWDGTAWSAVGGGLSGFVRALIVHDDGSGPALYAGGDLGTSGGVPMDRVAKWDGSQWSPVGTGMNLTVRALTSSVDSSGKPVLFAGGSFTTAGGGPAARVARWDGTEWSGVDTGFNDTVYALTAHDEDTAPSPTIYAGGEFTAAGSGSWVQVQRVARLKDEQWLPLGTAPDQDVHALLAVDDPAESGPALYVGGEFHAIGGLRARGIVGWDGARWLELGGGLANIRALAWHDEGSGSGPALYAGGSFSLGDTPLDRIARWDGAQWSPVGGGIAGTVYALKVFDDGVSGGPALYAAGGFMSAGGGPANRIAKWDGTQWSPLGSGLSGTAFALEVFDDGGGPALYAGGDFHSAGGTVVQGIARWNGAQWSELGNGLGRIHALTQFDDGTGNGASLYAGGEFISAGNRIARWNGVQWFTLGSGIGDGAVRALAPFDDGRGAGPALFAGGSFTLAGGAPASRIASWDGANWSALRGGANGPVHALAVLDADGCDQSALYAAGAFEAVVDSRDSRIARYGCPLGHFGAGYCHGDGSGHPCPCGNESAGAGGCRNSTGGGALLVGEGCSTVRKDAVTLAASGLPPFQPALLFQGDAASNGGQGVLLGDGLRCAGTNVIRIRVLVADAAGHAIYPGPADPALSAAGLAEPGDTKRYQLWYRDPAQGPCSHGFNLTNGYEIAWR